MGISHRTLQRIERAETEPTLSFIIRAAKALDVDYTSLIIHRDESTPIDLLSREEILQRPFGDELVKMAHAIDECIENVGVEHCLEKLKESSEFLDSDIPISISNFFEFYLNRKAGSVFGPSLVAQKEYVGGSTFSNRMDVVTAINQLFGKDKSWFSVVSEHVVGGKAIKVETVGYYRQYRNHFLTAVALVLK